MSYNILLEYDKAKKQANAEYAFGQSVSESIKKSSKQKSPRTSSLLESSSLEESHSLSVAASLCIASSRRAEPLRFFLLDFEAGGYGDTHVASSKSPNTYFSGQGQ